MKTPKKTQRKSDKFHFENGLLKKLRAKAAPLNKIVAEKARNTSARAAKKTPPKSILSDVPKSTIRKMLSS